MVGFVREEWGSVTFEAVLWVPMFAFLLWLLTETAMIFGGETRILHVVQDANRLYASGYFQTAAATENFILGRLPEWSGSMVVTTSESNHIIRTFVTIPVTKLTGINVIKQFSGFSVTVASEEVSEG